MAPIALCEDEYLQDDLDAEAYRQEECARARKEDVIGQFAAPEESHWSFLKPDPDDIPL